MSRRQAQRGAGHHSVSGTTTDVNTSSAATEELAAANNRRFKRQPDVKHDGQSEGQDAVQQWHVVVSAGIKFFVNDVTGEASDECPTQSKASSNGKQSNETMSSRDTLTKYMSQGSEVATGAMLYESREYEEAMRMLEKPKV
jgi:hypothetical protein